jgi:hypothetical protein
MTMRRIPERRRLPVLVGVSLVVLLLVAGAVIVAPRLVPATPTPSPSPSVSASPSPDPSTPESAVRAFFDGLVDARRTDDPSLIEPFVTNVQSSAYRTVAGFLAGQREAKKASITTLLELEEITVEETGDTARMRATLFEAGFDIGLDSGEPLESPVTLEPRDLTVELRRIDGTWKVDSFETRARGGPS